MKTSGFPNMLIGFWHDLLRPDVFWQSGALVLCLALALFASRMVRAQGQTEGRAWRLGRGGLKRLAFPLVALVLVMLAEALLQGHFHTHLLALAEPLLASFAAIRAVLYVLRYTFGAAAWLAPFERLFALLVWALVALHITGLLPELIRMMEGVSFDVGKQSLNLWIVLQGLVTVLATLFVALWLSGMVEERLQRIEGLDGNLRAVFTRLSKVFLILLAVLIGLPLVGIDLTTLSVFGGALGVGLGFGLQKIASNYVSGFIILLDHSISIGSLITVGSDRGLVTKITTRYTVVRSLSGVEAIVPNELLVSQVVRNESYTDPNMRFSLPVQVGYETDLDQAMRIMVEAARAQPRVLAEPGPGAFLVEFADSGINLELGYWIADPEQGTLQLRSDINLAIWRNFQAAGINIPYPQREVRLLGTPA